MPEGVRDSHEAALLSKRVLIAASWVEQQAGGKCADSIGMRGSCSACDLAKAVAGQTPPLAARIEIGRPVL